MEQIKLSFFQTPDKFITEAKEVVVPFVTLFQNYIREISPVLKEFHSLFEKNAKGEYSEKITETRAKSLNIKLSYFSDCVTDSIYISSGDIYPSRFAHFITGCEIDVIMKTKKRITLVVSYIDGCGNKEFQQFILRPTEDKWLLDYIGIGYEDVTGPFRKWNTI